MSTTYLNRLCLLALSLGVSTDFSRILRSDTLCREGGPATYHERPPRSADGRSIPAVNGEAMVKSLLCVILTAIFLATGAQAQESTPSGGTPSVADAARAKRERQKSTTPKHVITDDDIASKIGPADAADLGASEQEVRAEMEKNYSQPLTKADMMRQITQMQAVVRVGDAGMLTSFKQSALAGYEGVGFPGKKEWEQRLSVAASRMVEEEGKGVTRLQAIVDGNQNAIAGRDPTVLARMRETWIDALLSYATWQQRTRDLMETEKRARRPTRRETRLGPSNIATKP